MSPMLENLEYPKDFRDLNETNDCWMDMRPKSTRRRLPHPTTLIYNDFKLWYNYLKANLLPFYSPDQYDFLLRILQSLKQLRLNNESKYPTPDTIFRRFSASVTRSFRIMLSLYYDAIPVVERYIKRYPHLKFSEVFLVTVPKWHFTIEDISFINLVINATRHTPDSIRFIKVKNALQESVVIPYEMLETYKYQELTNSEELPYKPLDMLEMWPVNRNLNEILAIDWNIF